MHASARDLSIGYRLGLCFSLILLLMIGVAGVALGSARSSRDQLVHMVVASNGRLADLEAMRQHLVRQGMYAQQLAVVTTHDASLARMKDIEDEARRYHDVATRLDNQPVSAEERLYLVAMRGHAAAVVEPMKEARDSVNGFNPGRAARILNADVLPVHNRWLQDLDALLQWQYRKIETGLLAFDEGANRSDVAILTISAIALLLAGVVAWWLTRSITVPLREAVHFANAVAGGNLAISAPPAGADEPGQLLRALDNMALRLKDAHDSMQRLANEDGLTGAANRRHFDELLRQEHARSLRLRQRGETLPKQAQVSLLLFDVDHFKHYNDHFGHQQGDRCLQHIVNAVRGVGLRPDDVVARYGGEEFTLILPNCSTSGAVAVAERVRAAVAALRLPTDVPERPHVSVSIGVATLTDATRQSPADLVRWADEALYEAKRKGRNCVQTRSPVAEPPPVPETSEAQA
jgi:diguanylate cyclase (GGDEF)-like protein